MSNKNSRAAKKQRRELKRKKKALQVRKISTGLKTMYHFTSTTFIEGIKRYGLCMGDVIMNMKGLGYNAVNLTEEGHFHNPSNNQLKSLVRITVKMHTADCFNAKQLANETRTGLVHTKNEGNVAKHWYYFGQIKTEDFVDVCLWNGREFVSVELNDIKDGREKVGWFKKEPKSYTHNLRLCGNLHYDKSGVALQASDFFITSEIDKAIVSVTDAVNKLLWGTKLHSKWNYELIKFQMQGNVYGRIVEYGLYILLENNIEIPNTYLKSEFERKYQILSKIKRILSPHAKAVA